MFRPKDPKDQDRLWWMGEPNPYFDPKEPLPEFPDELRGMWRYHRHPEYLGSDDHKYHVASRRWFKERAELERAGFVEPLPKRSSFSYATPEAVQWQREHLANDELRLEARKAKLAEIHNRSIKQDVEMVAADDARRYYAPSGDLSWDTETYLRSGGSKSPYISEMEVEDTLKGLERDLDEMATKASVRREAAVEGANNPGHRQPEKFSKSKRKLWDWNHGYHAFEAIGRAEQAWRDAHPGQDRTDEYWGIEDRILPEWGYEWKPDPPSAWGPPSSDGQWFIPERRPGDDRVRGPRPAQKPIRLQDQARRAAEARRDRLSEDLRKEEL